MGNPVEVDHAGGWTADQRVELDAMRARCPVARVDHHWRFLGHAEVVAAATDPEIFSSAVTTRRAIPNSLDGEEHAAYRAIVDRYLTAERVSRLEPTCRDARAEKRPIGDTHEDNLIADRTGSTGPGDGLLLLHGAA